MYPVQAAVLATKLADGRPVPVTCKRRARARSVPEARVKDGQYQWNLVAKLAENNEASRQISDRTVAK
jgi:hypothetical protein